MKNFIEFSLKATKRKKFPRKFPKKKCQFVDFFKDFLIINFFSSYRFYFTHNQQQLAKKCGKIQNSHFFKLDFFHAQKNLSHGTNFPKKNVHCGEFFFIKKNKNNNKVQVFMDLEMNTAKIDYDSHRYPFCIVWTPIPLLTWLFPFIGHMGIATSQGIIRDFAGE